MRITGGTLGGRQIKVPKTGVRPTQDRVRAALFSILVSRIPGCRFVDLFAGSGSVGLEAWSRGAEFVCWVESDRRVRMILESNVNELCDSRATIMGVDSIHFLKKKLVDPGFDIIFCDPPYDKIGHRGMQDVLLDAARGGVLRPGGLLIVEQDAGERLAPHEGWGLVDDRVYGQTRLRFFRQVEPPDGIEGMIEIPAGHEREKETLT